VRYYGRVVAMAADDSSLMDSRTPPVIAAGLALGAGAWSQARIPPGTAADVRSPWTLCQL